MSTPFETGCLKPRMPTRPHGVVFWPDWTECEDDHHAQEWQLQEAKNNLSQQIREATHGDAQVVTVHGKPTAVVVSADTYARLTRPRRGKLSAALLLRPGLAGEDLDFARNPDTGRNVEP